MPLWSTTTLFVPSAARLPRAAAGKRGIPAPPVTIGLRRVDHGACEPVPALGVARRDSIHCCYRGKQARDGVRGVGEHDARAEDGQSTWVLQHMQPVSAAARPRKSRLQACGDSSAWPSSAGVRCDDDENMVVSTVDILCQCVDSTEACTQPRAIPLNAEQPSSGHGSAAAVVSTSAPLIGGLCHVAWQAWRPIPCHPKRHQTFVSSCAACRPFTLPLVPPGTAIACPLRSPETRAGAAQADLTHTRSCGLHSSAR